jgi:hypothetical protein
MMLNYFPTSTRELVVVSDHPNQTKFNQKFYHPEEEEENLFP